MFGSFKDKYIVYCLLFIVPFTSYAGEIKSNTIKGAFGVDFYSTLSDNEMDGCYDLYCTISPSTPYIIFSNYSVSLSPFKKQVFRIRGSGSVSSNSECIEHANKILRAINRKYNVQLKKIENNAPNGTFTTLWTTYIGEIPKGLWALYSDEKRKKIDLTCKDNSRFKWLGSLNKMFPSSPISRKYAIDITYTNYAVLANEKLMGMADEQGL